MPAATPASFDDLRRRAEKLAASRTSVFGAAASLASYVPPSFTWSDLARELAQPENVTKPHYVLALRACLDAEPSRLLDEEDKKDKEHPSDTSAAAHAAAARRNLVQFVGRVLSPIVDADESIGDGHDDDGTGDPRTRVVARCSLFAEDGVAVLQRIQRSAGAREADDDDDDDDTSQILFTLIALADAGQPWTTDTAAPAAAALLHHWLPSSFRKTQWLVDAILQTYLRPLFARARPAAVTASGRPAAYGGHDGARETTSLTESSAVKPWKYGDLRAVSVFAWAVAQADEPLVRAHWPLFMPVLLTLIDDPDTVVRVRGLVLLRDFLTHVPTADDDGGSGDSGLLRSTGLDRVLADAVFPTLLYLPRLTPLDESLRLLEPAYDVLLALARAVVTGTTGTTGHPPGPAATALLDRVLRDGVYAGYFHAREHGAIVAVLVRTAGRVVAALGVGAAKHLLHLMPLYAGVLTDPFAVRGAPTSVAAAAAALQTTVAACWPRFAGTPWQAETIRMLMLCWLHVEEAGGASEPAAEMDTAGLRAGLVRAADTLLAVLRAADVDVSATVGVLVAEEPRLQGLFRVEAGEARSIGD